jgi:hypothetical protein
MHAFVLEADRHLLDQMVRRELNAPTGGAEQFRAASSYVLLNFVDIATLSSADAPDSWLGSVPEKEAAIWVPVLDQRREALLWFVPYIFVDSSIAMAAGREAYGFPKQMGRVRIPTGRDAPSRLELDAECLDKHAPETIAGWHRVLRATRPRMAPAASLVPAWNYAGDFVRGMSDKLIPRLSSLGPRAPGPEEIPDYLVELTWQQADSFGDVELAILLASQLVAERVPMVLLKQFRDAAHRLQACYQGIIKVTNTVEAFRSGNFLPDDYTITIAHLDGEPICRELGLGTAPIQPEMAFWLEFDFVVEVGEVLWDTLGRRA